MYNNVGNKIMVLAEFLGWLCFSAGIIAWIALLASGNILLGWIMLGSGVVVLISSWFLYGLGQLVHDVHEIKDKGLASIAAPVSKPATRQKSDISDELPDL